MPGGDGRRGRVRGQLEGSGGGYEGGWRLYGAEAGGGEQEQQRGVKAALSFITTPLIYSQPGGSAISQLSPSMGILW